jgi:methylmalonyl-CoA carboxyltransferase 5S subunit
MKRLVEITELALRDAHQSLLATRLALEDMVPVCEDLDNAGFWSIECWGGATYDACIRFLNEDPWERLRTFRKLMPKSRLQMLLRGQNLVGYRHYGDDVVERFVERSAANGMDVFRVFDALNDVRNLRTALQAVKATGKHAQGTICYTTSPVHAIGDFVDMAERLVEMGCDSICIKDMAALLKPQPAYELVSGIKAACGNDVPVHVHVHATTGVTMVSLMKAVEAGADVVDTAVSSMSLGPGHNPTESFMEMLEGMSYTTRVDMKRVLRVKEHFRQMKARYAKYWTDFAGAETEIFASQIPGGMISNMESQLKQQGAGDRVREVLAEVPKVREDAGFPPLVTPSSQIVGTQAVFNVLMGRYEAMTGEFADLMLGYYGETSAPKNAKVIELATKKSKKRTITCRPADLIQPEWTQLRDQALQVKGCDGTDEDVLTWAMFPQVAPKFFETRPQGPKNPSKEEAPKAPATAAAAAAPASAQITAPVTYQVTCNGRSHRVTVAPVEAK